MKKLLPSLKNLLAKDIRSFLAALFVLVLLTVSGQSQAQVYYVTTAGNIGAADADDALLRVNYDGSSNTTLVGSIAVSPTYSALDLANNRIFVYEAIASSRSIKVLNATTGAVITSFGVLAGINNVNALKYDAVNDYIYYLTTDGSALSTAATDAVVRVKPDGTGQTVIASAFTPSPLYLALDPANNRVFVYESLNSVRGIKTLSLSSGTITQSAPVNAGTVKEIGYDASTDFLYYLTSDDIALNVAVTDALTKVKPDGTNTTVIKSALTGSPVLFALDAGNNRAFVYEGATANKAIKTVDLSSGDVASVISLSSYVSARVVTSMNVPALPTVTTASAASISSASASLGGTVTRSDASVTARGVVYSSSNASPTIGGSGVTQAANGTGTGAFSASITGLSSSTTYYVKAYATSGAGTVYGAVTTFATLSNDANLSGLSLSAGTLTPSFSSGTITYTASVANANSTITVTPTKNNANASIKVNNVAVNSGSASGNISLNVGSNTITTIVTAQDGSTTKTYTVTVTRATNPQSITFNALPGKTYGNADFSPGATASSGLTVSYSSDNTAVATIVSGNIHIVAAGTANITASQAGDVNTSPASNVVQALSVSKAAITATANAQTKVYGDADPAFTYSVTTGALVSGDAFTGALTRTDAGVNIGAYAITQGTLALSTNYNLTFVGANLTITKRPITMKPVTLTKVYGDTEPFRNAFSLTAGSIASEDGTSGQFGRVAGEGVGTYAVNLGGKLVVNIGSGAIVTNNYDITVEPVNFTITAKPITVTANAQTKTYGDADPTLTYGTSTALISGDAFSGALTRVTGEDFGTYAIGQGTLALNSNYTLSFTGANLTIDKKTVNVTANAQTKTYGDVDPTFTYTADALASGDSFTGSLTRDAGETVGSHAINQGSLALNNNYTLNFTGANLTIGTKTVNVTANTQTKTYGDADPTLTYTADALVSGDSFDGSLTRDAGETVGSHAINQGSLALNSNYTLNFTGANLTIGTKTVNVTANAQTKTYGDADPTLTYTADALASGDSFDGSLTRDAGETVGTHAINQGTLALNTNYTLSFTGANLTIGKKTVNVTANAKTKTYGDADPTLTYTADALASGDSFDGSLTRDAGETVGSHAIKQGSLALNNNYTLNFTGANLTIGTKTVNVTANAQTKTYGDADPTLTYTADALVSGDSFDGSLTRDAGETVGSHAINQGSLALNSNYTLNFTGANLTIGTKTVNVTANAQTKTYGDADPTLTYTADALASGDSFDGSLTRDAGETVGSHAITQGSLALNSNYTLNYTGAELSIGKHTLIYTANLVSRFFRAANPTLTGTVTGFVNGETISSATTGTLSFTTAATASSAVGNYLIIGSGLSATNYDFGQDAANSTALTVILSGDANLASLTVDQGSLSPDFSSDHENYSANVASTVTSFMLSATLSNEYASIMVNGQPFASGNTKSFSLNRGLNYFDVIVTAQDGVTTKTYTITVNRTGSNNAIASLKLTPSASLVTTSSAGTTVNYSTSVAPATSSIVITPTAQDANASILINGIPVVSGTASDPIALDMGPTIITVNVTAQDGVTTKTYTITVNRTGSNNAIASLKLTPSASLVTTSSAGTTVNYSTSVAPATSSIVITPTAQDANASILINGIPVVSGTASDPIALDMGPTIITVNVTAQDGVTTKTYTITVNRTGSNNAIASLKLTPSASLVTTSSAGTTVNYSTSVAPATSSIVITPTAQDANASILINGIPVVSGTASDPIALDMGPTIITVNVTAQDGVTTKTYTITVNRTGSNNAIASLKLTPSASLVTTSSAGTTVNYSTSVAPATSSIVITPTAQDANASILINGIPVVSGTASDPIALDMGPTIITVNVTAQDGVTTKTYTITVNRTGSNNAIASLKLTPSASLVTTSSAGTTVNYSTSVAPATSSIVITPTAQDANASILINGIPVVSGTASDPIALDMGPTIITVNVTAQDGVTTKTYTIAITRSGSNIASLSRISMLPSSVLELQQNTPSLVAYTRSVSPVTASIKLKATLMDANATMTINGMSALSGVVSNSIPLNVGTTTVNIVVTAQNGVTTRTYTITVTRPATFMIDRADSKLLFANKVVNPMDDPTDDDGVVVHQGVSPNGDGSNDFLSIEGISAYSGNKLSIMNANGALVFETKDYGKNSSNLFDGHSNKNGALLKPGTYFYSLEYKAGKEKRKTGYIILKY